MFQIAESVVNRLGGNACVFGKRADAGFDPVYGARPLRRAIQSEFEDVLAEKMLEGAVKAGDTVCIDVKENAFTFETR